MTQVINSRLNRALKKCLKLAGAIFRYIKKSTYLFVPRQDFIRSAMLRWAATLMLLGQTALAFSQDTDPQIRMTTRYDLLRKVDGKSVGMVYGYSVSTWTVAEPARDGSRKVRAWVWTVPESGKDLLKDSKEVSGEFVSNFSLKPNGAVSNVSSLPAPFWRSLPKAPPLGAGPGKKWQENATLVIDSSGRGLATWIEIPVYIEYTWKGEATWLGKPVIELYAKYAIRYKDGSNKKADPNLKQIEGTRDTTIYLNPQTYFPVFIREKVGKETWFFKDGSNRVDDGFILTFFEGGVPLEGSPGTAIHIADKSPEASQASSTQIALLESPKTSDRPKLSDSPTQNPTQSPIQSPSQSSSPIPSKSSTPDDKNQEPDWQDVVGPQVSKIVEILEKDRSKDITVYTDERGARLNLENLQFVADSAKLVGGESTRLDSIAKALKALGDGHRFLVIGHTAKAGSEAGQLSLSKERALQIVEELKKRGIKSDNLYFEGRGAKEPIADNNTDAGRAKNRRVEIIVIQ